MTALKTKKLRRAVMHFFKKALAFLWKHKKSIVRFILWVTGQLEKHG